jgi:hypothetical protein
MKKKKREELIEMIYDWIRAVIDSLDDKHEELALELFAEEVEYLESYYQPKEHQFCRAYTRTYPNLGVHSTQRNELYHVVVKVKLHKHLPFPNHRGPDKRDWSYL